MYRAIGASITGRRAHGALGPGGGTLRTAMPCHPRACTGVAVYTAFRTRGAQFRTGIAPPAICRSFAAASGAIGDRSAVAVVVVVAAATSTAALAAAATAITPPVVAARPANVHVEVPRVVVAVELVNEGWWTMAAVDGPNVHHGRYG